MINDLLSWAQRYETILWWIGSGSVAAFFGTLIAVTVIIARMPADHFIDRGAASQIRRKHPAIAVTLVIARNALGLLFVVAGIAMLVLPGQGLLTIFVGLLLLDFPGKHRFERFLITRHALQRPMNWIRRKAARPPLRFPEPPAH